MNIKFNFFMNIKLFFLIFIIFIKYKILSRTVSLMNSVNFVENVNLSEQKDGSNVIENLNVNMVICNKCKRKVDKLNTKRVFGQKNLYECKGDEFENCKTMLPPYGKAKLEELNVTV